MRYYLWSASPWNDISNLSTHLSKQVKNALISQFYNEFPKKLKNIDTSKYDSCESRPEISFFLIKILEETKKLISSTKDIGKTTFVINHNGDYNFFYNDEELNIKLLNSPEKLYEHISYEELWPKYRNDSKNFERCFKLYEKKYGQRLINTPKYSNTFMIDFLNSTQKYEIIESMGLRLSLEKSEATKQLKEHEIYNHKTKRHELRFRVDNFGNNIHCLYRKKENIVEFVNYFSSGKLDDYKKKN